jgi:hypothetical protein
VSQMTAGEPPDRRARSGDLVVTEPRTGPGPGQPAEFDIGVVSSTDRDGWVRAFESYRGYIQPVAFMPRHARQALRLVPQTDLEVNAAIEVAREHGPFTSMAEVRAAVRPMLRPSRDAELEAGS